MDSGSGHGERSQRLREGDAVQLEREGGDWMKGVVVAVEPDGIDVAVDGSILEGEVLSVSRTVRDDARYTAVLEVVDAAPGRSRVRLVGDWKRAQMRDFVRVAVYGMPVEVRVEGSGAPLLGKRANDRPPKLVDLSAGGLRFESHDRHPMGSSLELCFRLPETGPIRVRGEIVRMAESRGDDLRPCQYGIRFTDLAEATRVKLMTWAFAEKARLFREKKNEGEAEG